jgi:SulP family sulfate permease
VSSTHRTVLRRWFPTRQDLPHDGRGWTRDLLAGVTVGVVALPLALGFGIATGAGAAAGLVTAIVAGFVAALFGGSHLQVSGPTGAMTVVLVPAVAEHGVGAVPILAIMAGVIVVAAGLLGLGRAVTLIPWPVIEGFTFGIATIIFMQQIPLLLDVARPEGENTLLATVDVLRAAAWGDAVPSICIAAGVAATMLVARRFAPALPGSLVAILLATGVVWGFDLDLATIGHLELARLVDVPKLPGLDAAGALVRSALVVALLAALESLLSARVADGMSDVDHTDPDRELVGQGLANLASGLMGGMPATGAIARTAVNVRAGGRTRVAAASHAVVLLILLFGASTVLAHVPLAALAAVLMMTAIHMVEVPTIRALLGAGGSSSFVFCVTAATTILFDLARAVEVGILVAAVLVLRSSAQASGIHEEPIDDHLEAMDDDELSDLLHEHVVVFRLQGMLFFGAAQHFLDELAELDQARVIVLRLGQLQVLDVTGAQVLAETIDHHARRGVSVLICGARPQHRRVLGAVGVPGSRIRPNHMFQDLGSALARAREVAASHDMIRAE